MAVSTAPGTLTRRRRLLGLAIRHVPAIARSMRGTPAAGTRVVRFPAGGQQGVPLDVAVWTPPGHDRSATGSPVLVVLARHDGDWLPSTLAKDLRAVVVTMRPTTTRRRSRASPGSPPTRPGGTARRSGSGSSATAPVPTGRCASPRSPATPTAPPSCVSCS